MGIGKSHGAQTQPLGSEDVQGHREKALDSQKGNVKHTPVCEAVRARIGGAGERVSGLGDQHFGNLENILENQETIPGWGWGDQE